MQQGDRMRRWSQSMLVVPAAIMLLIVILGALRVSGSSIGLVADTDPSPQAALDMRPIRSDEWHLRTPMVVRQSAVDYAQYSDVAMGVHDAGALLDFPVKSLGSVVKPHSWPYFVVDVEHAFAFEWWLTVLGPMLGVYATLAVITRSRLISTLSGLLATAAPVMAWWTVPWLGLSVLYAGVMAAAVIAGGQRAGWKRYILFALGGWSGACLIAELYLPWVVPLAVLFAIVAISQIVRSFSSWRQLAYGLAAFGGTFGVMLLLFYTRHQDALTAIANSVYPGRRSTVSGDGSLLLMFSAPFDSYSVPNRMVIINNTNQSEGASGLMLWLPLVLVGGGFSGWRSRHAAPRALAAALGVALLFAAWALVPVPSTIGGLFGLTRVQGYRIAAPLSVASALAAGLYLHRLRTDGSFRPSRDRVMIAAVAFLSITGWAGAQLTVDGVAPHRLGVLLLIVLFSGATVAILRGRVVLGLGAACALLLFSTARVNPVQVGLGPITDSPLMHQVQEIRRTDPDARWTGTTGELQSFAVLDASGAPTVTGVDMYAVPERWKLLDPDGSDEAIWNRFANIDLALDNSAPTATIAVPQPDLIIITTPSCGGALQVLDVGYLTSIVSLDLPCLSLVDAPTVPGERWIYRVSAT